MKILWITNNIMPYPAKMMGIEPSNYGGWILSMLDSISQNENIELAIATVSSVKNIVEYKNNNIRYFVIPGKLNDKYYKKTEKYWLKLDKLFCADIVHLFGSEFYHGLAYLRSFPNKKSVLNIQGLVSLCGREYLAGMTNAEIIKNITLRDIIRRDSIFRAQKKFIARGKREREIIKKVDYVIGRTFWDYFNVISINSHVRYYKNNESLRKSFYNSEWSWEKMKPHTIFVSQASQPLKGLHMLLKALKIVQRQYPDVQVFVGGYCITDCSNFKKRIKLCGYGKYLINLIKKENLFENVTFLGNLNEQEVLEQMLKANIFVLPSKIENSSNSLGEAMLLGLPCIASFVGGTPDILENNVEGILYSYDDYEVLAQYIMKLFEDKDLCEKISKNARKKALVRHDLLKNINELYKIYNMIYNNEDKIRK